MIGRFPLNFILFDKIGNIYNYMYLNDKFKKIQKDALWHDSCLKKKVCGCESQSKMILYQKDQIPGSTQGNMPDVRLIV